MEPSRIEEDEKPDIEVDPEQVEQEEERARKRRRKMLDARLIQRILSNKMLWGGR